MQSAKPTPITVITAFTAAAAILLATWFFAVLLEQSTFYQQSRLFGSIASQDQVDILSVLTDGEKRGVLTKFIGAMTTAYINFEMIPYSEGQTFATIFGSLGPGIHIDQFEYKRRDLMIRGYADSAENYDSFSFLLSKSGHFSSVTGHKYLAVDNTIRFEIWCVSHQNTPPVLI